MFDIYIIILKISIFFFNFNKPFIYLIHSYFSMQTIIIKISHKYHEKTMP